MNDIVILGSSGVGRFVLHSIQEINLISKTWNIFGFIDDDLSKNDSYVDGIPVLGTSSWLKDNPGVAVVIALSDPAVKYRLVGRLQEFGCTNFPAIVHPHTWIAKDVTVGDGSIIYPGTSINVGSKIGRFVMINMNCAVGHDVTVEDYSFLAPNVGIGGNTHISKGCVVGIGSSVKQSITIGEWSVLGAGSAVIRNVDPGQTVGGVPAKPIRSISKIPKT